MCYTVSWVLNQFVTAAELPFSIISHCWSRSVLTAHRSNTEGQDCHTYVLNDTQEGEGRPCPFHPTHVTPVSPHCTPRWPVCHTSSHFSPLQPVEMSHVFGAPRPFRDAVGQVQFKYNPAKPFPLLLTWYLCPSLGVSRTPPAEEIHRFSFPLFESRLQRRLFSRVCKAL